MDMVSLMYGRQERGWQTKANCMGVDPDLFFPERGASTREAKEVCRGCVVREDCLEYALANGEKFGIWGGLSERERRRLRRQRAHAAAVRPALPERPAPGRRSVRARAEPGSMVSSLEVEFGLPVRRGRPRGRPAGTRPTSSARMHGAAPAAAASATRRRPRPVRPAPGSIRLQLTWARSATATRGCAAPGPRRASATSRATPSGRRRTVVRARRARRCRRPEPGGLRPRRRPRSGAVPAVRCRGPGRRTPRAAPRAGTVPGRRGSRAARAAGAAHRAKRSRAHEDSRGPRRSPPVRGGRRGRRRQPRNGGAPPTWPRRSIGAHGLGDDGPRGVLDVGRGSAEGQDRAVVVGVGVDVEQRSSPAAAIASMTGPVTALADVDDALGDGPPSGTSTRGIGAPAGGQTETRACDPAAAEDAAALALGLPAPHTVVDPLVEGVLQAGSATGHSAQIRWASCTPIPSLGKKKDGERSLHFPSLIQSVSMVPPSISGMVRGARPRRCSRSPPSSVPLPVSHPMAPSWGKSAGIDGFLTIFLSGTRAFLSTHRGA